MKSRILIFIFLIASSSVMGQSMLKVHLTDNSRINVSVDGRYFSKTGTSITVGDLPPGRHKLTIYTVQQTRNGRGREEAIYSGKVFTHNGNITLLTYDAYNQQPDIQEQDISTYQQNNPPNYNTGTNENHNPPQVNNNNADYGNDNRYIQPNAPVATPAATLTDTKTDDLKKKVADKKGDIEKMNVLKDGLNGETMTTDQVSAIMDWFNFEDSKVTFAKWAYPNTVDKGNFVSLENKLTYKNYVDDLDKFIKQQ